MYGCFEAVARVLRVVRANMAWSLASSSSDALHCCGRSVLTSEWPWVSDERHHQPSTSTSGHGFFASAKTFPAVYSSRKYLDADRKAVEVDEICQYDLCSTAFTTTDCCQL
jgi:hypothetical protein